MTSAPRGRRSASQYLAELSAAARGAKLDALRSGVAEARARREKENPPPDWWSRTWSWCSTWLWFAGDVVLGDVEWGLVELASATAWA